MPCALAGTRSVRLAGTLFGGAGRPQRARKCGRAVGEDQIPWRRRRLHRSRPTVLNIEWFGYDGAWPELTGGTSVAIESTDAAESRLRRLIQRRGLGAPWVVGDGRTTAGGSNDDRLRPVPPARRASRTTSLGWKNAAQLSDGRLPPWRR